MLEHKINGDGRKVEDNSVSNLHVLNRVQPSHDSRTWYVTPYGEIHKQMPTQGYVQNEEMLKWTWWNMKMKPTYELAKILLLYIPIKELREYLI